MFVVFSTAGRKDKEREKRKRGKKKRRERKRTTACVSVRVWIASEGFSVENLPASRTI